MKPKTRWILTGILLVIFAVSAFMFMRINLDYMNADKVYDEAETLAGAPDLATVKPLPQQTPASSSEDSSGTEEPDPYVTALMETDVASLQAVNDEVVGWIASPDTGINYPIVQAEDNDYYLNHSWKKTRTSAGAIFMDCANARDFTDFNTVLYGHRMNNDSMFGLLHKYEQQSFWETHPYIYIVDGEGITRYEIFAAYQASVIGLTYIQDFPDAASQQQFLDYCVEQSYIITGVKPSLTDHILTLSTCMARNQSEVRWVVQAIRRDTTPSALQ